jgi:hypothetical protein
MLYPATGDRVDSLEVLMALSSSALLPLAQMMGLEPADAIALPIVMEVAARKAGTTQDRVMFECFGNVALRDYLANACRHAIAQVAA